MTNKGVIGAGRGWLTSFAVFLALGAITLVAPGVAHAAGKIKVVQSVEVTGSAGDVWKVVGAFDRLQDWHPAVDSTTMNGSPTAVGSHRVLHLKGGGDIEEELTSYSDSNTRLTYAILSGPLPVSNYESYIGVVDAGNGKSLVIWGSSFDPGGGATAAKAKSVIESVYKAGLDTLKTKFGAAPAAKAAPKMKKSHKKK